ncbi:DegT/DnrJ/EryC1/StrS family aminotransferase [Schleiferiaceae bacterium]|nr:DegT/DnrJ/EryC1/StrS family aminotransferase [Schleiferiaceae bacterium]
MMEIKMVDLGRQLHPIRSEIDFAISSVLEKGDFIQGTPVREFEKNLSKWIGTKHVITCANGTDALQLAFMALGLKPGDEVLVPTFTYVATAEVIALLGLSPILVDVDSQTFNIDIETASNLVTSKTKAVVPVHLYGQCANMEQIIKFAESHNLHVVEDTAQAIGAEVKFSDGSTRKAGTIGHIGTTSFFPSKNLGCFGDGGAIFTNDDNLAARLKMIANHGQRIKYHHDVVGVNSRLDTIQAAVLDLKLKHLNSYCEARQKAANYYDSALKHFEQINIPFRSSFSTHVFHQYTIKIDGQFSRDELKSYLAEQGIPSMIYYPLPLHEQKAYLEFLPGDMDYPISTSLCNSVLSLPMHTHLKIEEQDFIVQHIKSFFSK